MQTITLLHAVFGWKFKLSDRLDLFRIYIDLCRIENDPLFDPKGQVGDTKRAVAQLIDYRRSGKEPPHKDGKYTGS